MPRFALAAPLALVAAPLTAQSLPPGSFVDLTAYEQIVSMGLSSGDFIGLIGRLSDISDLPAEDIASMEASIARSFTETYSNSAVVLQERTGEGFIKEIRAFWSDGDVYGYYFALLHAREDKLKVLHFGFNTSLIDALGAL